MSEHSWIKDVKLGDELVAELEDDFEEDLDEEDKQLFKELDDMLYGEKEELHCNEKCIHSVGGICDASDWACRTRLDKEEMKFN